MKNTTLLNRVAITVLWIAAGLGLTATASAAPTIGTTMVAPSVIPANVPTTVKITAIIADPTLIPNSVNLIQINPDGTSTVLGLLRDDGQNGDAAAGDHVYTLVRAFASQPRQIQLKVSAAFTGLLRRVLSPALPLLSMAVPSSFSLNLGPLAAGGPMALNNFQNSYTRGGIIPAGGAEIDATSTSLPPPPLSDFIAFEMQGSSVASTLAIIVSGVSCTQVFYTDTFTSELTYKNVAVYCPSGKVLYKFFLSYRSGDPAENQYLASFQQFVNTAQFAP